MSEQVLTIAVGDRRTPWSFKLRRYKKPLNIASLTVEIFGYKDDGSNWISSTSTNLTKQPTVSVTFSTSTHKATAEEHVVEQGDEIIFATSGSLPAPLVAGTRYYAVNIEPHAFQVSLVPGGQPIELTNAGSGSHTYFIVGHVQYAPTADNVGTAGDFWAWLKVIGSTLADTYPTASRKKNLRGYKIEIYQPA